MVTNQYLPALIPLFPLLGFLMIALLVRKLAPSVASMIACTTVFISFILSLFVFFQLPENGSATRILLLEWIKAGSFAVDFSFLIDPLTSLMLLIITGVGFLIHVYSISYMHGDEGFNRYFSYLNLFVFFMLLLVMGSNYLLMFIGWEGVGLCSYLLIGFWFKNQAYNDAANKAFIMNRIGDLGMLLGMILIFINFGSLEYAEVFTKADSAETGTLTLITLLLFVGAMGKSAQLPLYTWLPDAMAGPTPVSALIHAATMVTAGIYMIARNNILFTLAPISQDVVAYTGLATALFAATIAIAQNDIKKVLAYSTVSQLGLMFLALGLGAYSSGVFHMATHAFFKALLFLGAGSVIHALHGEQDLRRMGGLKKYLPATFITFLIGTLAITGIPPFAGFFSKDEILAKAFEHSLALWILTVTVSLLTVFYMFRLLFLAFYSTARATQDQMKHIHESPAKMLVPLFLLAALSTLSGFAGMPAAFHAPHWLGGFLGPVFQASTDIQTHHVPEHMTEYLLMGVMIALTLLVILLAYYRYVKGNRVPVAEGKSRSGIHNLVYRKYYIDEVYDSIIVRPIQSGSLIIERMIERFALGKLINGFGSVVTFSGRAVRLAQTGNIGSYILFMVIGIVALLVISLLV